MRIKRKNILNRNIKCSNCDSIISIVHKTTCMNSSSEASETIYPTSKGTTKKSRIYLRKDTCMFTHKSSYSAVNEVVLNCKGCNASNSIILEID